MKTASIIVALLFSNLAVAETINSPNQPLYSDDNPNIAIPQAIEKSCYKYTKSNTSDGYCQCLATRIYKSTVISEQTKTKLVRDFAEIIDDASFFSSKEGKEFNKNADGCVLQTRNWATTK